MSLHGSLATDHITTAGLFLSRRISSAITSTWWSKLSFPKLFLQEKTGSIKTKYLAENQKEDTRFKVSERSLSENLNDERELLVQGQFRMPLVFEVRKRATSFPGFSPTRPTEREPWERGWEKGGSCSAVTYYCFPAP